MTRTRRLRTRGFTLVELLTVISIIALLISILLPSLAKARGQAKKVKVQTQIDAISKGLEMFRNEHRDQYPDSAASVLNGATWQARQDPVTGVTSVQNADDSGTVTVADNAQLNGAHWLARAMLGYDLRGVDADFRTLDGPTIATTVLTRTTPPPPERLSTFIQLDSAKAVRDSDPTATKLPLPNDTTARTGRFVLLDGYGFPILYYRANPQGNGLRDARSSDTANSGQAVYYQEDNAFFTGNSSLAGWQFKMRPHALKDFGDTSSANGVDTPNTFVNFFHNHDVHQASGGMIAPYNSDSFILLSAGEDGVYGTRDDVKNFKIAP